MNAQINHGSLIKDNARLRVLAEVSQDFAEVGTEYQVLIDKIAATMAAIVGDACMVTLLDLSDGESIYNAASAHRDPDLQSDYKAFLSTIKLSKSSSTSVSAQVIREGQSKIADVNPEDMVARAEDKIKPIVKRLNVHSYAVIPIRARGSVIGTLSLLRSTANNSYKNTDLILLQDLADRSGLAIENARLYDNLEKRVAECTAELELINRELESFSHAVAHDLRSPLRSISSFSQILAEDHGPQLGEEGKDLIKRIVLASSRMSKLIDSLPERDHRGRR